MDFGPTLTFTAGIDWSSSAQKAVFGQLSDRQGLTKACASRLDGTFQLVPGWDQSLPAGN
jgi:hypothetical protein